MYRVMVVDDEPTAIELIKTVIEYKCEHFIVSDVANDGAEALEKMEKDPPDLVITDIRMPVMDGLELAKKCREKYPDIMTIIISGYQEFAYAKEAIHQGVTDYILKPIVPSELEKLLEQLEKKLKHLFYIKRNRLIRRLVKGENVDREELLRAFPDQHYYGAIVRLNGLPSRFSLRGGGEVFSDINEWMITYGRDEQETLYLCPLEIMDGIDYIEEMKRHICKEQPEAAYVTKLIAREPVSVEQLGMLIRGLYRMLDLKLIIGQNQTLILDSVPENEMKQETVSYDYLVKMEELLKNDSFLSFKRETEHLLRKWEEESCPQIIIESRIRQLCFLLKKYNAGKNSMEWEFLLDELFANAENLFQIIEGVKDILFDGIEEGEKICRKMDSEESFNKIRKYIQMHMAESMSLQSVSKSVGVSQPYLSRLFRKYENTSFSNYLTGLRIERAKELLAGNGKVYVKDVAEQVGYKDQFYFSRIFFSYTGVRPSEYIGEVSNCEGIYT